jgi:hypothetical protein
MRKEISILNIEFDKIKYEEDIQLINEFEEKHFLLLLQYIAQFNLSLSKTSSIVNISFIFLFYVKIKLGKL